MAATEQEHAEILAQVNRELQEFGQIMPGTRASMDALSVGGKAATAAFDGVGKAAGSVAKAYYDAAAAMYNGEKGMKAYNKSIDSGADAIVALTASASAAAVAVGLVTAGVGLLVAGVAVAAKAVADYAKAANEQSDALFDSYQKLSRVGAAGADSLQGIYNDMQKLGLGVKDLDKFVALVAGSSKELAMMSGSVSKGRKEYADITKGMDKFKMSLLNSGMTQDEINEGTIDYIRLQSRYGLTQKKSVDELAISTAAYLKEQDALTQLTGLTRKEQSDERERLRNDQAFGAKIAFMKMSGDKKQVDAAKEMEDIIILMSASSQQAADGLRDIASGNLTTDASRKIMRESGGEAQRVMQDLAVGLGNAKEGIDRVAKPMIATAMREGKVLSQFRVYDDVYTSITGTLRLKANLESGDMAKRAKKIEEDRKKMGAEDGKALSAEQQRQAELAQIQQDSMHNMQDFVRYGVTPATEATAWFAKTVENVTSLLPGAGKAREEAKLDQSRRAIEEQNAKIAAAMEKQKKSTNAAELETAKLAEKTAREKRELLDKERKEFLKTSEYFGEKQYPKVGPNGPIGGGGGRGGIGRAPPAATPATPATPAPATPATPAGETKKSYSPEMGSYLKKVAQVESSGKRDAQPPINKKTGGRASSAAGLFQFVDKTWLETTKAMGKNYPLSDRFDPAKAAEVAAFFSEQNKKQLVEGINPGRGKKRIEGMGPDYKPTDADAYMAHFLGAAGALKFLKAMQTTPNMPAEDAVGKSAANSNPNIFYSGFKNFTETPTDKLPKRTLAEVYGMMSKKLDRGAQEIAQGRTTEDVLQLGDGGIVAPKPGGTHAIIGEAGQSEAVIPLKGGKVPVHIDSAMSFGGHNELRGYNAGAMTTDLAMLEKVAGKLGAYDKSTQMITDPKLWKDILQSGMMINYDLGGAQAGTKDLSSRIGAETVADALAGRLKELIDTKKEDNSEAIAQTRTEFADMMKTFYEQVLTKMTADMMKESPVEAEILATLKEISRTNSDVADTSEKMLRVAQN